MTDAALHLRASFLHEAFSDRSGVPLDFFELYYRGKRLEGEAALASWGVGKGSTIEVKMRGRGGGNAGAKVNAMQLQATGTLVDMPNLKGTPAPSHGRLQQRHSSFGTPSLPLESFALDPAFGSLAPGLACP
eukprot:scaffold2265_cov62-Phaeocystis_antarctica.AAC.6